MKRSFHAVAVHLALAAIVLRALLPAGWMPGQTASGDPGFVICTMQGVETASGAVGETQNPHHKSGQANSVCPFAATAHSASGPFMASLPAPVSFATAEANYAWLTILTAHYQYTPQSPRAPPHFA